MDALRRQGERIVVVMEGKEVEVTILQIRDGAVRIRVEAPDGAAVYRGEVRDAVLSSAEADRSEETD